MKKLPSFCLLKTIIFMLRKFLSSLKLTGFQSMFDRNLEVRICAIACSKPPEGASRWTMQAIADELIRLEVVDYITESTICEVMKKTRSNRDP